MPAQPLKLTNTHLTQVGIESSYGNQSSALATADTSFTFHTRAEPVITPGVQFDGNLEGEGSPGGSTRPNIATSGRYGTVELETYFRACTATYSGTVYPDLVRALRAHGLALSFAAGTLTLVPQRGSFTSAAVDVYLHGELEHLYGLFFNEISCDLAPGKVPVWKLKGQGIRSQPIDASVPALGYQSYNRGYAKFVTGASPAMYIKNGAVTTPLWVREGTWSSKRTVTEIMNSAEASDSGLRHPGFTLENEIATFEGVVEARRRSNSTSSPYLTSSFGGEFDPTKQFDDGIIFECGIQSGAMSGQNGFKITSLNSCWTAEPTREKNGAQALWRVKLDMNASTDVAADTYAITFQ